VGEEAAAMRSMRRSSVRVLRRRDWRDRMREAVEVCVGG
jgi:hypothetical protein